MRLLSDSGCQILTVGSGVLGFKNRLAVATRTRRQTLTSNKAASQRKIGAGPQPANRLEKSGNRDTILGEEPADLGLWQRRRGGQLDGTVSWGYPSVNG